MGSHLTKKDYKFFDMARKVAEQSDFENFHLGAVLVYQGRVISTGCNSNKTHPLQKKYNKYRHFKKSSRPIKNSLHSEISCLVNIPKCVENNIDFTRCKIYIYRIPKNKKMICGESKPCPACEKMLRDKGIRKVYYTSNNAFCYMELW